MNILRSPYYKDIPKVFKMFKARNNEVLVGPYAKLIENFAYYKGYQLELHEEQDYKLSDIERQIKRNIYNISLNAANYDSRLTDIAYSYPLEWSNTCVMVPAKDELPKFWYIAWPFGRYIWTYLALSVFYVAYVMTYLKHPTKYFFTNLLPSLSLVMYCSNASMRFNNMPLRLQMFYTLMLVLGFIMSSYYCSFLTMYNMRPVFQPFIKTLEDALDANIKILISSNTLEELKSNIYVNSTHFSRLFRERSALEITERIQNLDRSFAYVVTQTQWNFITQLQKNLIQPVYQISDICFGYVFNSYPLQKNSEFTHTLNVFIMWIRQSGLWSMWEEHAFILALSNESYNLLQDDYPVDPLNLYYYKIGWIILVGGLALSLLCFLGEILVFKYGLRFKIKFNKH